VPAMRHSSISTRNLYMYLLGCTTPKFYFDGSARGPLPSFGSYPLSGHDMTIDSPPFRARDQGRSYRILLLM